MALEERYLHDPLFNKLVDWMEKFMHDSQYTPTDIKDAVTLACFHYEKNWPRYNYPAEFIKKEDYHGDT